MSDARPITSADIAGLLTEKALAPILGSALIFRGTFSGNIDELRTPGYWLVQNGGITSGKPLPKNHQSIVEVMERSGGYLQRMTLTNGSCIYLRFFAGSSQTWNDWYEYKGTLIATS